MFTVAHSFSRVASVGSNENQEDSHGETGKDRLISEGNVDSTVIVDNESVATSSAPHSSRGFSKDRLGIQNLASGHGVLHGIHLV